MANPIPLPMPPREQLYDEYVIQGMTFPQLREKYGISAGTLSKWMKLLKIETRGRAYIRVMHGEKHRRCYGPKHNGDWLPISKFHRSKGKPLGVKPRCTECMGVSQRIVYSVKYKAWVKSIVARLGYMEGARRLGVSERTLRTWMGLDKQHRPPRTISRQNAIKIVALLGELKLTGEVRHRKSIRRGAAARGETERKPVRPRDFYFSHGDADTEQKRQQRLRQSEAA